jgi:hypothetical protein
MVYSDLKAAARAISDPNRNLRKREIKHQTKVLRRTAERHANGGRTAREGQLSRQKLLL